MYTQNQFYHYQHIEEDEIRLHEAKLSNDLDLLQCTISCSENLILEMNINYLFVIQTKSVGNNEINFTIGHYYAENLQILTKVTFCLFQWAQKI